MKSKLISLARHVQEGLQKLPQPPRGARSGSVSPGGDAQFDVDEVAEQLVLEAVERFFPEGACIYTEDGAKKQLGNDDSILLLIDPIDGTRPAAAGFGQAMISIATLPNREGVTLGEVTHALLMNVATGYWIYAERDGEIDISWGDYDCSRNFNEVEIEQMFWSFELNGHPMKLMTSALGELVDETANTGGVFVFNSSSYSIASVILGQTDAYVDIGNRILKDNPSTEIDFRRVGHGSILHLFPYDIAAAVTIARQAGIVITDAYGERLDSVLATDLSADNQRSCVAAANLTLHKELLSRINFSIGKTEK